MAGIANETPGAPLTGLGRPPEPPLVRALRALGWGLARIFSIVALALAWEWFARSGAVTPFMLPKLSA